MGLQLEILTLFPEMISAYVGRSILAKAIVHSHVMLTVSDIRAFAMGKHRVTDDAPYGGGAGMVMKVEPLFQAIAAARRRLPQAPVLLLSPRGAIFSQRKAQELAQLGSMILVCGRYEGIDERVMSAIDLELSLGDFILTGGELAALCIMDAVARFVPGVLGNAHSLVTESFQAGFLEHPHYTRPPEYQGMSVPKVLQSGNHARIAKWRRWHSLKSTQVRRADLFEKISLSQADQALLEKAEEDL